MTPEEQLLDELLDETKAGSINQTIKIHPDVNRIDKTKTSGREHRALLAAMITRIKAWVVKLLAGKADIDPATGKVKADQLPAAQSITVDDKLSSTSTNPLQNKVVKAALDSLQVTGYETSYFFQGSTEVMDRFTEAIEFTAIDTGALLSSTVDISVDGGAYQALAVGFKVAAGKRFKLRITYATGTTEGVLITKVKKQ